MTDSFRADNLLRRNFAPTVENLVRAGLSRAEAEMEAARVTGTLARNLGYSWEDLRAALAGHPAILPLLPDTQGTVDSLPLGPASYAVRMDGLVRRQGAYIEAPSLP